jgi:hypothetical protein
MSLCAIHRAASFLFLGLIAFGLVSVTDGVGQTRRVNISHPVNTFRPVYALGTTVDRVPSNATDTFFAPDQIKEILAAGWGVISYRQNTDLFGQAWHWNPRGTWSDPSGTGYFTGDPTPTEELIRHSYGYSLRHRGFTRNNGTEFDGFPGWMMERCSPTGKVIRISPKNSPEKMTPLTRNGW